MHGPSPSKGMALEDLTPTLQRAPPLAASPLSGVLLIVDSI
jgi:hypothetical protein